MSSNENDVVDRVFEQSSNCEEIVLKALEFQNTFVAEIEEENFDEAFANLDYAEAIFLKLIDQPALEDMQEVYVKLSLVKAYACRAVGERRRGNRDAAAEAFSAANDMLDSLHAVMIENAQEDDDDEMELVDDWHATKGGLLMNMGVFENTAGNTEEALRIWDEAEEHLFGHYIRSVGPTADLEATAKTINLWENIMSAALAKGDGDRAAHMTVNALKIYSYWPAHDLEVPDVVTEALSAFLGSVVNCEPAQRSLLNKHLPPEIVDVIASLTGEDGD